MAIMVVDARALTAPLPASGVGAKVGKADRLASMMSKEADCNEAELRNKKIGLVTGFFFFFSPEGG